MSNFPLAGAALLAGLALGTSAQSVDGGWRGVLLTGAGTELHLDFVVRTVPGGHAAYLVDIPAFGKGRGAKGSRLTRQGSENQRQREETRHHGEA